MQGADDAAIDAHALPVVNCLFDGRPEIVTELDS
jgi:hypothetical protein